jgi:hypothetical protein
VVQRKFFGGSGSALDVRHIDDDDRRSQRGVEDLEWWLLGGKSLLDALAVLEPLIVKAFGNDGGDSWMHPVLFQ